MRLCSKPKELGTAGDCRGGYGSDPKFCRGKFKWPRKIMAFAGITGSGSRFLSFLKPSVMMNSAKYCKMLTGEPKWIVRSKR